MGSLTLDALPMLLPPRGSAERTYLNRRPATSRKSTNGVSRRPNEVPPGD